MWGVFCHKFMSKSKDVVFSTPLLAEPFRLLRKGINMVRHIDMWVFTVMTMGFKY